MKKLLIATVSVCAMAWSFAVPLSVAQAQTAQAMPGKPAAAQEMIAAEVKKIDKDTGKVLLSHGEVKSLSLPASTNVYDVRDPAMWSLLSEGAKVRVSLAKSAAGYVVVHVEPAA